MKLLTWASFLRLLHISEKNLGVSWISAIFSLCKKLLELQWTWEYQWISNLPPPIKKGKSLVTEILQHLVRSSQVLFTLQCFMAGSHHVPRFCWAVRVQKIAPFYQLHVDQEVPGTGSPSKSCGGFVGFPKSLPFHFFYPILRFLRIFVNFRGFWPLFEMMTIQGLRAEAEWPADWTKSTCFLLLWSQRGRKYIAFLLFSYILCDTDKDI